MKAFTILFLLLYFATSASAEVRIITASYYYETGTEYYANLSLVNDLIRKGWRIIEVKDVRKTFIFILQSPDAKETK